MPVAGSELKLQPAAQQQGTEAPRHGELQYLGPVEHIMRCGFKEEDRASIGTFRCSACRRHATGERNAPKCVNNVCKVIVTLRETSFKARMSVSELPVESDREGRQDKALGSKPEDPVHPWNCTLEDVSQLLEAVLWHRCTQFIRTIYLHVCKYSCMFGKSPTKKRHQKAQFSILGPRGGSSPEVASSPRPHRRKSVLTIVGHKPDLWQTVIIPQPELPALVRLDLAYCTGGEAYYCDTENLVGMAFH